MTFPTKSAKKALSKVSKDPMKKRSGVNHKIKPPQRSAMKAVVNASSKGIPKVPGAASFPGDDIRNDKVPVMMSPGEGVLPRSLMQMLPPGVMAGMPHMADGGMVPAAPEPGLISAIKAWFSSDPSEAASRNVAEQANKSLPRMISGRDAVEKKRAQLKKLDDQTKE